MNGMGEGLASLQFHQPVGQLGFESLDGLAEPADAFIELIRRHRIGRHPIEEAGLVDADARFNAAWCGGNQLAG